MTKKLFLAATCYILIYYPFSFSFAQSVPKLVFDSEIHNFGKVKQGAIVEHTFKFKNEGDSNLLIYTVKATCGCIKTELSISTIEPRGEGSIKVIWKAPKKLGTTSEIIYVVSNDPKRPNVILGVLADISVYQNPVRMYYFYSRDSKECLEIKDTYILQLNKKYNSRLEVKYLDIKEPKNLELLLNLEKKFKHLKNPPPSIFIGNQVLDGKEEVREKLEETINSYVLQGGCDWPSLPEQEPRQAYNLVLERFRNLGVPLIIGAGLLDGINPCAFATIIFLISYLALVGRRGRDILLIGWSFTFAVFVTYLAIGLGLFELIRGIAVYPLISRIVSLLIAGLAAVLGALSLYDYYKIKKGRLKEIALQLPKAFKDKIHSAIREESRMKHFILASLSLGFIVALLEFPCTGQTYLPIIFVLRNVSYLKVRALSYLLLYNLMFIIPLIVIFIFAYKGASSSAFTKLMQENAGKVKIFMAILFFVLSVILVVSI